MDALIVLATQTIKNDFLYQVRVLMGTKDNSTENNSQEAFLTTYRTFIAPELLIAKLVYRWCLILLNSGFTLTSIVLQTKNRSRFRKFNGPEHGSLRLSRAAFSLLVRVVDSLAEVLYLDLECWWKCVSPASTKTKGA